MSNSTITFKTQDIERLFVDWLRGESVPLSLNQFQKVLAESEAKLPELVCEEQGFPFGTTFGHAVRSSISFVNQYGDEYRLETHIGFQDEAESLRWWRNNRDNPHRVRLRHVGGGKWALEVADIDGPKKRKKRK